MAKLPLSAAILRLLGNEDRFNTFTHGRDNDTYTTQGGQVVPSILKFLKDTKAQIAAATGAVAKADDAQAPKIRIAMGRPRSARYGSGLYPRNGTFEAWAWLVQPSRVIEVPGNFVVWLVGVGFESINITTMKLQIFKVANAQVGSSVPGNGEMIYSQVYQIEDILEDTPRSDIGQRAEMKTPGLSRLEVGFTYFYALDAYMADGTPAAFGVAQAPARTGGSVLDYGMVRINSNWFGVSGNPVAFELGETVLADDDALDPPRLEHVSSVGAQPTHWDDLSTLIPELRMDRGRSPFMINDPTQPDGKRLVTFGQPGSITKTIRLPIQNVSLALEHEHVRNVSVVRVSNGAPMIEGSDYKVNYAQGRINNPGASGFVEADITYTADLTRYDSVWVDPQTGAIGNTAGPPRGKDVAEFVPEIPLGMIRIYNAYVTAQNGVDLVPTYTHRYGARIGQEGEFLSWLSEMRIRLPKLFKKMRNGDPITICQVGDSIQAMGGQTPQQYTTPNGISRDNPVIYFGGSGIGTGVGEDFYNSIELFDHNDGDGRIHMHIGWVWHLKAAIESCSSSIVTIKNLAVGGSDTTEVVPGGNSPEMLAAYSATNADLYLANFGMNSAGSDFFFLQTVALYRSLRSFGGEVIDMLIPLTPQIGGIMDVSEWFELNNQKVRASEQVNSEVGGVAYVPAALVCHPDNLGAMGLARNTLCTAGKFNHPGRAEMAIYGKFLSKIVLGA